MPILTEATAGERFGVFKKSKKPDSNRHVYTPDGPTAYRVQRLELQPPEGSVSPKKAMIKVVFDSRDERDRFHDAVAKRVRDSGGSLLPGTSMKEHYLLVSALASKSMHEPLLRVLEKGGLHW
jgi:hypothetical protein